MPKAERMRLAGSPSLTARIGGMPPATAASNPSMTRLRRASAKISAPWWASSALFAVTTCLPDASAFRMKVRAGSRPPTSSITICTSGSSSTRLASPTSGSRPRSSPSRGRVRSASATRRSTSRQPARSCISAPWLSSTLTTPLPTVPRPRSAILISSITLGGGLRQLGGGLRLPSEASPRTQGEPQDVAGAGRAAARPGAGPPACEASDLITPRRPGRAIRRACAGKAGARNVDRGARACLRRPPGCVADQPPFERRLGRRNPARGGVSEGAVEAPPSPLSRGEGLQAAQGLFDPLLVLDEGEPDIALAVFAEADAGRDRHLALLDQHLGELERAHDAVGLGDGRPDEHGAPGLGHRPPELVESVHEDVAPLPVELDDLSDHGRVALQRDDAGDLDGLECPVVEEGLDPGEGVDHPGVAAHEAQPPTGHVD